MQLMTGIQRAAVIGAGTMGWQIALQIAQHGFTVALYDIDQSALQAAQTMQSETVAAWRAAGKLAAETETAIFRSIAYQTDLITAVRDVDLAIEAVPEKLELKREVFAQLDRRLPEHAIIASNSSSICASLLEDATERAEQVANLHFYLPVWDSPMVEFGGGSRTRPDVLDALDLFARKIGMLPLRVRRESTGFIFNRVWRAIKKEVMKVADSGVASFEDIDRAWMIKFGGGNLPPFAQMDRIGLDVIEDIERHYTSQSGDPDDLPPPILTARVARGDLGVKTGRGFYEYPHPTYAQPDFLKPGSADG